VKHGFINQKLGKRNTRRGDLLKSKNYAQPSARPPKSSKDLDLSRKGRGS
jgi:hypothetical protein